MTKIIKFAFLSRARLLSLCDFVHLVFISRHFVKNANWNIFPIIHEKNNAELNNKWKIINNKFCAYGHSQELWQLASFFATFVRPELHTNVNEKNEQADKRRGDANRTKYSLTMVN